MLLSPSSDVSKPDSSFAVFVSSSSCFIYPAKWCAPAQLGLEMRYIR